MTKPLQISICMIVKNEEEMLDISLGSANRTGIFSEIIVADTGSTDKSKEKAAQHGAKLLDFVWCGDFSAARNFVAAAASNDWILALDADEEITNIDRDALEKFIAEDGISGSFTLVEKLDGAHNAIARFYNKKIHRFVGKVHEQIASTDGKPLLTKPSPIQAAHHGYLPEYGRTEDKLQRNEALLQKELDQNPKDPYNLYQMGKTYFCAGRDYYKATVFFSDALKEKPDTGLSYVYNLVECLGYAYVNSGQSDKALEHFEDYKHVYWANHPGFRFMAAHIFQENGMFSDAVESYESCIGAGGQDFRGITSYLSYFNIGVILEVAGLADNAVNFYKACGEYEPAKKRLADMRGLPC